MERRTTADEIEKLELRVSIAESALERELQWKDDVIAEVRKTHEDHRRAIVQESMVMKLVNDKYVCCCHSFTSDHIYIF